MDAALARVLRRRLATQRLAGAPFAAPADAVRTLACVQAQDAPMAAYGLALRSRARARAGVDADQARGGFVRTHILRPTWHLVAPEDLRWILRLTSPAVERGMGARHRQLGLDDPAVVTAAHRALERLLAGRTPMTRGELTAHLAPEGPLRGQQAGHLLALAELRGLICSGPPRGGQHTYALVDETVPAGPDDDPPREVAVARLVHRFFAGHGPATDRDMARWCTLGLREIRAGVADLGDRLASVTVGDATLHMDPDAKARARSAPAALLLSTFDEAALTYRDHGFPRASPAVDRSRLIAEQGGGVVIVGLEDVGTFTRTVTGGRVDVTIRQERPLDASERDAVAGAAGRLAAFHEAGADVRFAGPRGDGGG
ncbi:MAG: AlkZ family DNA glycosylase [Thermoleophilia bacterium]|nr:AlkZ family DNA glycosylase [Thermoleophilia bacterium]